MLGGYLVLSSQVKRGSAGPGGLGSGHELPWRTGYLPQTDPSNWICDQGSTWFSVQRDHLLENRPRSKRARCKIASKITKFMIEIGGAGAKDGKVN